MVTVNDDDEFWTFGVCWICGDSHGHGGHRGQSHAVATGDGVTRYQIVEIMNANGWGWRTEW